MLTRAAPQRQRFPRGSEADAAGGGTWSVDRWRGLGRDVAAAVGVWIGGGLGVLVSAGGVALVLCVSQIRELFDGAEEAAAEMSVVAGQVNEGLGG